MNSRLTARDRGLIKGSIRRAFSRSALHKKAMDNEKIVHSDPKRPRVKTWYKCEHCGGKFAAHQLSVDHVNPIVPVNTTLEQMSWDELIDRTWCEEIDLQVLCDLCHDIKTSKEREQRKEYKRVKSSKTSQRST